MDFGNERGAGRLVRPGREGIKGGYYHVIARGNNRKYIFRKDVDKNYFLKLLNESRQPMRNKLMGYGYTLREIDNGIGQSGNSI